MTRLTLTDQMEMTRTTHDGFKVMPSLRLSMQYGVTDHEQDGWSARYVGDGRYYYDASHGATADEALDKARKAMARRLAQRDEDEAIEAAYGGDAHRLAPYARSFMPKTGLPDNLKPGQQVWVWGHGKARRAIVGSVSKTGKRARVIWVAPSNLTVHITTASLSDLRSAA
jgi:hypothetical protein